MKSITVMGVLICTLLSATTAAQTSASPGVGKRQIHQQKRIAEGVRSGELTARETIKLERQQAHLQADKRAAKADGVVTTAERAQLHAEQNQMSRQIYKKKHNQRQQ